MSRRFLTPLIVALVAVVVLPACGRRDTFKDELLEAVQRTDTLAKRFVYTDERPDDSATRERGRTFVVQGLVEDDFRYKARVALNDTDTLDAVVSDDLLAVRFLDPRRLGSYVNKQKVPEADLDTDVEGMSVLQALETRRWVVDASGAPFRTAGAPRDRDLGEDPVLDAITALAYVEEAVEQAASVERWSEEDLTPAYSRSEDTFPKPEEGSGVVRYDLVRPPLPAPSQQEGRSESAMPTTRHFRRMAVYVKDGRVIQVVEHIDLRGKFLDDFITYMRTFMEEAEVAEAQLDELDAMRDEVRDLDEEEKAEVGLELLQGFSVGLGAFGGEPILVRNMRLDLRDLGNDIEVELPLTDVVKADLGILRITDAGKVEEDEGSGAAPTGAQP